MKHRHGNYFEELVTERYQNIWYPIDKFYSTKNDRMDLSAYRKHGGITIEYKTGKQTITRTVIEKSYRKSIPVKAKPILDVSSRIKIIRPAKDWTRRLGAKIKRL